MLEYRGSDRLYLPVDQIDAVTPYTGGEVPSLSKMGGADWQRTRARAPGGGRRDRGGAGRPLPAPGPASPATPSRPTRRGSTRWRPAFPFTETPDQLRAIADVKADMEADRPMDRLVCGDVGFGKTEVALRAVFKAVQDGSRPRCSCRPRCSPSQHFATFSERFAGYPVRVEMLSRFLSPAQADRSSTGSLDGSVDVVIGTHRLLGRGRGLQEPRSARRRRGAALRRHPQGGGEGD